MKCLAPAFADRQDRQLELSKTNAPAPPPPPPELQVQTHPAPAFKIGGAERNDRTCWKPPLKLAVSLELRPTPILTGSLKPSGDSRSSQTANGGKSWEVSIRGVVHCAAPTSCELWPQKLPQKNCPFHPLTTYTFPQLGRESSQSAFTATGPLLHQLTDGVPRAPGSKRNGRWKEESVSSRVPGSQTPSPGYLSSLRSKTKTKNPTGLWQRYILGANDRPPKWRCVLTACRRQPRLRRGLRAEPQAL